MQSGHIPAQNVQWSSKMKIVCSPIDEAIHIHHPCEKYEVPIQETMEHDTTTTLPEYERVCNLQECKGTYYDPVSTHSVQWSSRMNIICSPVDEAVHKQGLYHLYERYEDLVQKTLESETVKASAEFERMNIAQEFSGQRIYNGHVPNVQWSSKMAIVCSPTDDEFHEPEKPEVQFLLPVQDTLKHKTGKELTESIVTGRARARLLELMTSDKVHV